MKLNSSGGVVDDLDYMAFGNRLTGSVSNSRFTDKVEDSTSGLLYFNARYYDPAIGWFISEDPIRDGLNWYVYCSNNPLMFVDPMGLKHELDESESGIEDETIEEMIDLGIITEISFGGIPGAICGKAQGEEVLAYQNYLFPWETGNCNNACVYLCALKMAFHHLGITMTPDKVYVLTYLMGFTSGDYATGNMDNAIIDIANYVLGFYRSSEEFYYSGQTSNLLFIDLVSSDYIIALGQSLKTGGPHSSLMTPTEGMIYDPVSYGVEINLFWPGRFVYKAWDLFHYSVRKK